MAKSKASEPPQSDKSQSPAMATTGAVAGIQNSITADARGSVHHYHMDLMDGSMRFDAPQSSDTCYEPDTIGGPAQDPKVAEPPLNVSGDAERYDHRFGNDDHTRAGNLFRLISDDQRQQRFGDIAAAMEGVPEEIKLRQLVHFHRAVPADGKGAPGLGSLPTE